MQEENKPYLSQEEKMVCYTEGHIIWNSSCSAYFFERLLWCKPLGQTLQEENNSFDSFFNKEKCFHRKFDFHKSVISAQFLYKHLVCHCHCIWNVTLECSSLLNKQVFKRSLYFSTVRALIYLKFSRLFISVRISLTEKQRWGQWSWTVSTDILHS